MQTLDIISVNLWQILISLCNLVLLFLVVKKFLFKPVKNVMEKRQKEIDERYAAADAAREEANESKTQWETKLSQADAQADDILRRATDDAKARGDKMIAEAQARAELLVQRAQTEAELERQKATEDIKHEIVAVSGALAEKLLEREINADDHKVLIHSFIDRIGDEDE